MEAKILKDVPLQTVTIVYHHVQDANFVDRTTNTYTTTFTNTPGLYTLWPMFYKPENQYPRGIEVMELPVTLESDGSGGIYTHTKTLEPAVRSPIRTSTTLRTARATQTATHIEMIEIAHESLADTIKGSHITPESSPQHGLLNGLHEAVTTTNIYGWLIVVLCVTLMTFAWSQRHQRQMRRRLLLDVEEKPNDGRLD